MWFKYLLRWLVAVVAVVVGTQHRTRLKLNTSTIVAVVVGHSKITHTKVITVLIEIRVR